MLGGPVGPRLADLLDPRIHVPDSVRQEDDQYHIILEYRDGDKWGDTISKCSNRFILTRDMPNARMASMEAFFGKDYLIIKLPFNLDMSRRASRAQDFFSYLQTHLVSGTMKQRCSDWQFLFIVQGSGGASH